MDYSEVTDRISRKFSKSGHEIDRQKVEGKLRRLTEEFGVQPAEAERSVTNELNKEFGITPTAGPGAVAPGGGATEEKKVAEIQPGDWVTLVGKIVSLSAPVSPAIAQSGIIGDESGGIRFVVWTKSNAPKMEEGKWYKLESAVADEFKGVTNLKVHSGTTITELDKTDALMPAPVPVKGSKTRGRKRPGKGGAGVGCDPRPDAPVGPLGRRDRHDQVCHLEGAGQGEARAQLRVFCFLGAGRRVQRAALAQYHGRDISCRKRATSQRLPAPATLR